MAENITDLTSYPGYETLDVDGMLRILAKSRRAHEDAKAALDAARAEWEAAHADLIEQEAMERKRVTSLDEWIRSVVEDANRAGKLDAKPAPGLEIKSVEVPVFEPADAAAWARQYMPGLLALDEKAYGKVLREVTNSKTLTAVLPAMPGLMVADAKAYIARDLSTYLEAPNGTDND